MSDTLATIEPELRALAEHALRYAQQQGASEAAVQIGCGRFVEVRRREGAIERLRASTSRGLSLSLFCEGRYSANATSVLERSAVERFVDESLAMTRHLHPDPHRALADPTLYGPSSPGAPLELYDDSYDALTMDERLAALSRLEAAAREALGGAEASISSGHTSQSSASLQLHSNGFAGQRERTHFVCGASVSVRDVGDKRPQDHAWVTCCQRADLPELQEVGAEAARRTLARRGAKKIGSGRMVLVVENRAAGRLVSALLAPLTGRSLQQGRSFLQDKEGERIGSELLTLIDDPFIPRGLGSRTFDGDGLAVQRRALVERGELRLPLIDVYYGRKLGRSPTGGSTSNLSLPGGHGDLHALVAEVPRGVLVTSFLGGNANAATGDFSFGIGGQAIVDGELAGAVGEMNISGNQLALWPQLTAVGADPYPYSAWRLPSLRFDGVHFSGV